VAVSAPLHRVCLPARPSTPNPQFPTPFQFVAVLLPPEKTSSLSRSLALSDSLSLTLPFCLSLAGIGSGSDQVRAREGIEPPRMSSAAVFARQSGAG
jgi:hypothetical protein